MPDQETEISLGIGKLLGMFFGLVVLCGVFFVTGYSMGRNSAPARATLTEAIAPENAQSATQKPTAAQVVNSKVDCAQTVQGCPLADTDTAAASSATRTPDFPSVSAKPSSIPAARTEPATAGNYTVQVAAISKEQDAEALVAALRRKQYAVFIAPQGADSLFHVQIGPFSDNKEAEAMRTRLIADGYNPIVKR